MNRTTDFNKEFKDKFGELTGEQLWLLVKFAKNVRLRCRNNSAFNNFCNLTFSPYAKFRTVNKTKPDGTIYPGLEIKVKEAVHSDEDED